MKITIEVDCTPEEVCAFMGMPDVRPMKDEIMADMKERMTEAAKNFEPEAALRTWMGSSGDGMGQMIRFSQQIGQEKDKA